VVCLWLSLLAKRKTFNVLYVGRGKYLSSTVNPNVAKQIYMMSELCRRYQRIFIHQFSWILNLLSYIYWNFCAKFIIFLRDIEEKESECFFYWNTVYAIFSVFSSCRLHYRASWSSSTDTLISWYGPLTEWQGPILQTWPSLHFKH